MCYQIKNDNITSDVVVSIYNDSYICHVLLLSAVFGLTFIINTIKHKTVCKVLKYYNFSFLKIKQGIRKVNDMIYEQTTYSAGA